MESAVLAILIRSQPRALTMDEVCAELNAYSEVPEPSATVEQAVEGLAGVGLVLRSGDALEPTAASLRVVELELGI